MQSESGCSRGQHICGRTLRSHRQHFALTVAETNARSSTTCGIAHHADNITILEELADLSSLALAILHSDLSGTLPRQLEHRAQHGITGAGDSTCAEQIACTHGTSRDRVVH